MSAGRPPIFKDDSELTKKVEEYFNGIADEMKNPTITGLALFLGFESRQSFYDYESKGEFSYTIKRARLSIERAYEEALLSKNSTGAIFALKNFGWQDKSEIKNTGMVLTAAVTPEEAKEISKALDDKY